MIYKKDKFYLDEKEIKIYSGAIHYFRVLPEYWEDRLLKLKAAGFNTVETYINWSLHEPKENVFDFSGRLDFVKFLKTAQKIGLYAIVRPSAYICAEVDFGGMPPWLLKYDDMNLRCSDKKFVKYTTRYYNKILPLLRPLLYQNGGNIIMMQIENEYGSYGNDKKYLNGIKSVYRKNGIDCLTVTSDGACHMMLSGGTIKNVLPTLNFGSGAKEAFGYLKKTMPKMCMEFWCGWFDWWGEKHHQRNVEEFEKAFRELLDQDANFNMYMVNGGTNFGFLAGANYRNGYTPTATTYDYFALINEWGNYTPMYYSIRKLLFEKRGENAIKAELPLPPMTQNIGKVKLTEYADFFDNLENISEKHHSIKPLSMEKYDQNYGIIFYENTLRGKYEDNILKIENVRDIASVYIEGVKTATVSRMNDGIYENLFNDNPLEVKGFDGEKKIGVLTEALGRINYGERLKDSKGISDVIYGCQSLSHYTVYSVDFSKIERLQYSRSYKQCPVFLKGEFKAEKGKECFVSFEGFTRGYIFVNGFNLGRYWNIGPQKTLYLPSALLKENNEIIVFELVGFERGEIVITDQANLGE